MVKILVAEDERDIRDLIRFTLDLADFEVVLAQDGVEAVEEALAESPDLILLDVRMPRLSGYEACRRLKHHPSTSDIPIVFLSAKGQEREIEEGMDSGALDYIVKPFAPDQLIDQVRDVLQRTGALPG
jgi:DNA-binding response OmpR family regulator